MIESEPTVGTSPRKLNDWGLFDDAVLGVMITDADRRVNYINKEAARILGMSGRHVPDHESYMEIESILDGGLKDSFEAVLNGDVFRREEFPFTNRNEQLFVVNLYASPIRSNGRFSEGGLYLIQDVSDSYVRRSSLEKANYELSVLWQVSGALSRAMELNQIIRIILTGVTAYQGLGFNRAFFFLADDSETSLTGCMGIGPRDPEEAGQIWHQLAAQEKSLADLLSGHLNDIDADRGLLTPMIEDWCISVQDDSVFADAVKAKKGLNVNYDNSLSPLSREIMSRLHSDNIAVAPVYGRDKLLGLIAADNQIIRKPIADFDVRLLQTFANHSAVAIERSRLYDGLREYTARLEEKNRLLAESQEQLVRIEKMSIIGELTSSIAHELRNPLTVIGGFANLILSSDKVRDYHEYLNVIVSEAKRAETVLHQVLDFSRASETAVVDIEIGSLLKKTYELFVSQLKPAQNPPRTGFTHDRAFARGNPTQLQHAFFQFMKITADEIIDEFRPIFKTEIDTDVYRFIIEFDIVPEQREKILDILREVFGTAAGKERLSLIVAGETIKYHRGHFGVAGGKTHPPRIYIELPLKEE